MPSLLRLALLALTFISWGVLVATLTPYGDGLDTDLVTFARTVAVTGAIAMLVIRTLPPADEVLRIGKLLGRAELQRELEAENVTQLRPALRAVGDGTTPE